MSNKEIKAKLKLPKAKLKVKTSLEGVASTLVDKIEANSPKIKKKKKK